MEIQKLTVAEKITLAEALWDSVAEQEMDLDLTMEKTLDSRLASFEIDGQHGDSWSQVKARVLSK